MSGFCYIKINNACPSFLKCIIFWAMSQNVPNLLHIWLDVFPLRMILRLKLISESKTKLPYLSIAWLSTVWLGSLPCDAGA